MNQIVFTVKSKEGFDIFDYKLSIYQNHHLRISRILDAACKIQDKDLFVPWSFFFLMMVTFSLFRYFNLKEKMVLKSQKKNIEGGSETRQKRSQESGLITQNLPLRVVILKMVNMVEAEELNL